MGYIVLKLDKRLPSTQQMLLVSSIPAAGYGHYWPSAGIKYQYKIIFMFIPRILINKCLLYTNICTNN